MFLHINHICNIQSLAARWWLVDSLQKYCEILLAISPINPINILIITKCRHWWLISVLIVYFRDITWMTKVLLKKFENVKKIMKIKNGCHISTRYPIFTKMWSGEEKVTMHLYIKFGDNQKKRSADTAFNVKSC